MTRIYALICFLALALAACSAVNPYLKPIASCAGKSVSAADANEIFADLLSANYADLAVVGVRIGYDVLACVIADVTSQNPGLAAPAAEFKRAHAVEFRAAGVS